MLWSPRVSTSEREGASVGHPIEDLIRRGYDAFSRGDMDTLRELYHPDIVWHAPGRSQLAGDHQGVDAVFGFFGRTMELTGGNFGVEPWRAGDEGSVEHGARQPTRSVDAPPSAA